MKYIIVALLSGIFYSSHSQVLTQSNLPIVIIDTDGRVIFDEPKIPASMKIIHNNGTANVVSQDSTHFEGTIGIELRGQSSQSIFPKKGYGLEVRDSDGNDLDTCLLDMPSESDWVIHSPYSDKSLIRNALAYQLAGLIMPYAPRTKLAELVLNDQYEGVILWTEKIKRNKNRVAINKLKVDENEGDDLTGGYIVRFDKGDNNEVAWVSPYRPIPGRSQDTRFLYHYPKVNDITAQQRNYIREYITNFENTLMSDGFDDPITGYRQYADASSFVQLFIINEISRNVDGYRLSTYMYKDKDSNDGKLTMGPVWDYNLAFGNADYCNGSSIVGWAYQFNQVCPGDFWVNHVWWLRLLEDERFRQELKDTWQSLRSKTFSDDALINRIDSLTGLLSSPQQRNFQRWRVLGNYVWPNEFVGNTYASEVNYLKDWLLRRVGWLDSNFDALTTPTEEVYLSKSITYPNPTQDRLTIDLSAYDAMPDLIQLYNDRGQLLSETVVDGPVAEFSLGQLPAQHLFFRIIKDGEIIEINKVEVIAP